MKRWNATMTTWAQVIALVGVTLAATFSIGWWCSGIDHRLAKLEDKVDLLLDAQPKMVLCER